MAHIYVGEASRIDGEALDAMRTLPDDFWVFAEFNGIGRNVDWLVTRAAVQQPSVLMLMELKRVSHPVRGSIDSAWEILTEAGTWQEIAPSNSKDINYYWQSVNTANVLAEWLWNHQHLYRAGADIRPQDEFKVWPDLVLLSPADTGHRLPLGPPSRYGRWWYSLNDWLRHVLSWKPRSGIGLGPGELSGLGEALGLSVAPMLGGRATESTGRPPGELLAFLDWARRLEERAANLEARLARLESQIAVRERPPLVASGEPVHESWPAEPAEHLDGSLEAPRRRLLSEEERAALLAALAELRQRGRSRALPMALEVMNLKLGYRLQDTNYNGYGSARVMFDQARSEQIIRYGGYSGPNPLVYAADEDLPVA